MLLLVIHLLLIATTVVLLLSYFPLKGRVGYLLAGFLLAVGLIVLLVEALSLAASLTPAALWIAESAALALAFCGWLLGGRKKLLAPFRDPRTSKKTGLCSRQSPRHYSACWRWACSHG